MRPNKALEFYEKLYFYEIENKDKIHNRAQASFGLFVIAMTVLTYLAKNTSSDNHHNLANTVLFLVAISFGMIIFSCFLMIRVIWRNQFRYCPHATDLDNYNLALIAHEKEYKEYSDDNELEYDNSLDANTKMLEYLHSEIIKCATHNSDINQVRTQKLYKSLHIFFWSLLPLIIAVILFLVADLDAASLRKKNEPQYLIIPLDNIRRT
ncbi:hypothetical protein [Pantoea stewartii]|uniref:hypothetical protein n=1 Tax=Pantoea stewartii TaxID=66269 RepID=UPI0033666A14